LSLLPRAAILKIEVGPNYALRVGPFYALSSILQALRERLRRKEIWVKGADRYRNPDEDVPADFDTQRTAYYAALQLSQDADAFIAQVRQEMTAALVDLDQ
jgi:hypothetical protein